MKCVSFLWKMKPDVLAKHLVGGLTVGEMEQWASTWPQSQRDLARRGRGGTEPGFFVLPPVPNYALPA